MSYKIFNAYRVPSDISIGRINEVLNNIKDILKPHVEKHLRQSILNKTITLHFSSLKSSLTEDSSNDSKTKSWKEKIGESIGISESVYDALILEPEYNSEGFIDLEKCIEFINTNLLFLIDHSNKSELKKDNALTSEVTLDFFSRKRNTYFRIFSPLNGDIQTYLGDAYKGYDYRYFDYCDKPKEYTKEDWDERHDAWHDIYMGHESNKFTTAIFDAPSIAKPEKLFANSNELKEEATYIYNAKRDIFVFSYYIDKKIREAKSNSLSVVTIGENTYNTDDFKNSSAYFDVISDLNIYKKKQPDEFKEYVQEYLSRISEPEDIFQNLIAVKKKHM